MRTIPILLAALLAPGAAGAAGPPQTLTPEKAVALALERHPLVRAADREVDAAAADTKTARSGWIPRVDVTEDWVRSTNPTFVFASKLGQERFSASDFALETLNRPDPLTNSALRLVVRQNVWDAGRTPLYRESASLGLEAAESGRARARDEIAFGAVRAYWDAVLASEMLDVARAAETAAAENARIAGEHVDAGLGVPSDRLQAEVRLKEVRAMRIRAEQGRQVAFAALRQAMGVPDDTEIEMAPPPVSAAEADGAPPAVDDAVAGRADLRAMGLRERQAEVGERIARSSFLPEIGVLGQYEMNGSTLFGSDGTNWTVGASIRIPVFTGTEGNSRLARARADRARTEANRDAMTDGVRLQVRASAAERAAAAERLATAESALGLADEALRIVRERYQEELAVMVELLGAEAARTSARGSRAAAARDLAVARASSELAAGRPPLPAPPATETAR